MQFIVGLILGAVFGFIVASVLAYEKINNTRIDGNNTGKEAGGEDDLG